MTSEGKLVKPGKPRWFVFEETRIRLSDIQAWNWNEHKNVINIWLRHRDGSFTFSCDVTQKLEFEKVTQYL